MISGSLRVIHRVSTSTCLQIKKQSCSSAFPLLLNHNKGKTSVSLQISAAIMRTVSSNRPNSRSISSPTSSQSHLNSVVAPTAQSKCLELNPTLDTSKNQITSRLTIDPDHYHLGDSSEEPLVVCVEGNIGCGKTTLLNYFENMGSCEVIAEPVDKWRNVAGFNPLAMMYGDPSRWAMALQTYIQLTMLQVHTRQVKSKVRLMERSVFSAKHCFVDNLYKSGTMHEMEYIILSKWFDWIVEYHNIKVDLIVDLNISMACNSIHFSSLSLEQYGKDGFLGRLLTRAARKSEFFKQVYLRTDPVKLHERIMKRCREEETCIPVEYLQALHQQHEDWLVHKKIPCPADVLVLDANASLEQMKLIYDQHKSGILNARLQEAQIS